MPIPYDFYPAVLYAIDLISQGETVTASCDEANINVNTLHRYVEKDIELQKLMTEAQHRGHDALADALIHIDSDVRFGHTDARMAKVLSDNIKWLLAKRDTKRFGDRIEVKHDITIDVAITSALEGARNRMNLIEQDEPIVIDLTPGEDDEELKALLT